MQNTEAIHGMLVPSSFPPSCYAGFGIAAWKKGVHKKKERPVWGWKGRAAREWSVLTWQNILRYQTKETPPVPEALPVDDFSHSEECFYNMNNCLAMPLILNFSNHRIFIYLCSCSEFTVNTLLIAFLLILFISVLWASDSASPKRIINILILRAW